MRTMCSREIFTKECRQQQIFDSDLKGAWHYNHVTFAPIVKHFMLYCRLIYMLSILCVRLTIKVKVEIPESLKVEWYPPKKLGRVTLSCFENYQSRENFEPQDRHSSDSVCIPGLLTGRGRKSQISRDFWGQIRGKIGRSHDNFAGVFAANFPKKQSVETADFVVIFKANFARNQLTCDQAICADQTSVFNVFLTEIIICSFNNNALQRNEPMAKPLTSWLVPSFSQHNVRLVVSERCLHVSVTKFQDKFASLRQVNSPNN